MNKERYLELEFNPELKLTKEEIEEGWHFCDDWDGMLIHKCWSEFDTCCCDYNIHSSEEGEND